MEENNTANTPEATVAPRQKELTVRAVICGLLIGLLMDGVIMYLMIKVGMSIPVAPIAALLAMAALPLIGGKASTLEVNIVQTMSSAVAYSCCAGAMTIPAIIMFGAKFDWWLFILVFVFSNVFGVCVVAWIRKKTLENKNLTWPAAVVIENVVEKTADPPKQDLRILIWAIVAGFILSALISVLRIIPSTIDFTPLLPKNGMILSISIMPMMLALGYILDFKISCTMALTAIFGGLVLAPIGTSLGWFPNPQDPMGQAAMGNFNISIVIGFALAGSILPLIMQKRGGGALQLQKLSLKEEGREIPIRLTSVISLACIVAVAIVLKLYFDFSPVFSGIIMLAMILFAFMDVASSGQTGITITTILDMLLIFVLGVIIKQPVLTLIIVTVASSVIGLASDTMTDWKVGAYVVSSPKSLLYAQLIGIVPGVIFGLVIAYAYITKGIGTPEAPFPYAAMFYGLAGAAAEGMAGAISWLNMGIGALLGVGATFLGIPAIAVGLALYLGSGPMIMMGIGGLIRLIIRKAKGEETAAKWINGASGIFVGDGLVAVLTMLISVFA